MTEEVSLEDLQKQVLELQKKLEEQTTKSEATEKELAATKETLGKARDLNADLMSRVPGDNAAPKNDDPYADMTDEEFLEDAINRIVDEAAKKKS